MSLLVVDDSEAFRRHVEKVLMRYGVVGLKFASTAGDAIEMLGLRSAHRPVDDMDLIMIDVKLPDMDGIDLCMMFKREEALKDTPILIATSSDDLETLEKAFNAGAHDFMIKPMTDLELIARVRAAIAFKLEINKRNVHAAELLKIGQELAEANERLMQLSMIDGLTGIANRRSFDEYIDKTTALSAREEKPISAIIIDIDFFKPYNDTHGHIAGDDCLKQVALTIRNTVKRKSDMVARYGGEEFVVVLPGTDLQGAKTTAEEIRDAVEKQRMPHGSSVVSPYVTISLGVACITPRPNTRREAVISMADVALYRAKEHGRNRVEVEKL